MSTRRAFDHGIPSDFDVRSADQLRKILAASITTETDETSFEIAAPGEDPVRIVLTHGVAQTMLDLLRLIGSQRGFFVMPYGAELTTQQAADILNVSRPFLIKLINDGEINCEKVGRHRRIKAADLFEYQEKRDKTRAAALSDMAERDSELGLI